MTKPLFSATDRAFHDESLRLFDASIHRFQQCYADVVQNGVGIVRVSFDPTFFELLAERLTPTDPRALESV